MRQYISLIHKDAHSDYGVSFPDFPGCITAGRYLDDARAMAEEVLAPHVEGLIANPQRHGFAKRGKTARHECEISFDHPIKFQERLFAKDDAIHAPERDEQLVSRPEELHPRHRVTGGGRPPPVPTDRSVRISRTTLFRR